MAKVFKSAVAAHEPMPKGTSIGRGNVKKASMNKHKKRSWKKYRGQG
jgi:hypothetical protein